MDSKYDQKFEEMKKYIPFLEDMIKRLESTSQGSANPRQAQLDKIRSLRDLLLNKKKRMKMENLLKCEQVLINLYAKVEQRDTISTIKKAPDPGLSKDPPQEKSKLEVVRNKLKSVVKRQDEEVQETLPEILRVNEVEEVHTAGSKEPALFQRRPNRSPLSPTRSLTKEGRLSPPSSASKRNYTRVLLSPDREARRWSTSESTDDKPLFSRRSPRRSPRRRSPAYHKRERKKSFKESKDLNITLNVPEDSLSTLNTKDIFTRIINCSDGDVDIDTLRVLRKQILTELKKTGARDDISDLILKSYSKKKGKSRKKEEVEEGELSDSESEVIQNLYGNLSGNLVLKDQNDAKTSSDKDKARKIQICLVINSDKDNNDAQTNKVTDLPNNSDTLELEMYNAESKEDKQTASNKEADQKQLIKIDDGDDNDNVDDKAVPHEQNTENQVKENQSTLKEMKNISDTDVKLQQPAEECKHEKPVTEPIQNKANFYNPTDSAVDDEKKLEEENVVLPADTQNVTNIKTDPKSETTSSDVSVSSNKVCHIDAELQKMEKPVEIPLLNEPIIPETSTKNTVSEIDILQALKKEILSESISIPGAEASTPLLHQPKLNKVESAKEIFTKKKKISIENYKQKIESSIRFYVPDNDSKDDLVKKPSLKLTEKECERFNFPKMSFDEDSSGEEESEIKASDVYSDLAPTSPDREESATVGSIPPVIIPVDPVKAVPVANKVDVDMRTLPLLSPNQNKQPTTNATKPLSNEVKMAPTKIDTKIIDQSKCQNRPTVLDPRIRRDINSSQSPSPHTADRSRSSAFTNVNQSPATNASMTPNSRSYEMTPNHQSFDHDQAKTKHVYMPSFSMFDSRERENSVSRESREKVERPESRKSRFEDIGDSSWSSSDVPNARYNDSYKGQKTDRYRLDNRDSYKRTESHMTPVQTFGRSSDGPNTSTQQFSRLDKPMTPSHPFGRSDCPTTPIHSFGRSECPPTPSHPFGRSECPPTPSHSFGRSECPPTPSHSFGRSECPPTPGHSFGRSECPPTPSHSFGRSECPPTPSHSFGMSDGPSPNHPFSIQSTFMNMECPTSTPSHSFGVTDCAPTPKPYYDYGRNECPPTPNHAFGRSEHPKTPSHPFGRSDTPNMFGRNDCNAQKYTKDPRLNRKPEYDSHSQFDERDRGYYKDRGYYRGGSYKSQKPLSVPDSYQNQDRERGRNSTYRYYAPELSGRQLNKDQSRREPNVGGPIPRDYDNRRNFYKESRGYDDVSQRNQRERSVGRNVYPENNREVSVGQHSRRHEGNFNQSLTRRPSVVAPIPLEPESNTLSIKPHAGRSFAIDTSVNATFQKFLERTRKSQACEDNFDARRKRASSVGRSLVPEFSGGRISDDSKRNFEINNKRELFRRASSVGRDLRSDSPAEKRSFQEIKAEFKTYKHPVKDFNKFDTGKIRNIDTKSKNSADNVVRSRKDYYEQYKNEKRIPKSKTFNYVDPATRKLNKLRNKYGEDPRQRKSGIVYSNDNIVKGAILTPGYGVKNYKIPKIKRVTEEKEVIPKIDEPVHKKDDIEKEKKNTEKKKEEEELIKNKSNYKNKVTSKQNDKNAHSGLKDSETAKNKEIKKGKNKESDVKSDSETDQSQTSVDSTSKSEEQVGRRRTRWSTKVAASNTEGIRKTKKSRISIISDSESDTDTKDSKTDTLDSDIRKSVTPVSSPIKEKTVPKQTNAIDIHTNFGLELEMFSDNVVSDPVLDNINALIADLDNDLDRSKNEASNKFTKEITVENMMQNITCPQDNASTEEISKVLNINELPITDKKVPVVSLSDTIKTKETEGITEKTKMTDSISKLDTTNSSDVVSLPKGAEKDTEDESMDTDKPTNVDIVSTTDTEKEKIPIDDKSKIDERSMDGCSTPDSTINTDDVLEKSKNDEVVVDSTNEEVQSETNVTSTDSEPKPSSSRTETAPSELDSLLTILQDKSLNDLLKKLTDKTDGKTRKMLEKISKIVADDEPDEKTEEKGENKIEISFAANESSCIDNTKANEKKIVSELLLDKNEEKESKKVKDTQCNTEKDQSNKEEDTESRKEEDSKSTVEETQLNKDEDIKSKGENQENDENQDHDESFEDFVGDDSNEEEDTSEQVSKTRGRKKMPVKKTKYAKKGKRKYTRKTTMAEKRVTRASAAVVTQKKNKKPPRELQNLHADIKEMYDRDDILSATGIRMCRLAKMVHDKSPPKDDVLPEVEPVVVLEKFKNKVPESDKIRDQPIPEKVRKKPGPKPKPKVSTESLPEPEKGKYKPGPKSRIKSKRDSDPYDFDTESLDTTTEKASDDDSEDSSDSEVGSLASSKSFGSSEVLSEIKKKTKRKRRGGWQDGVIKPKHKKKKVETKVDSTPEPMDTNLTSEKQSAIQTSISFTDRLYCFSKNESVYSCRLCRYTGTDIVHHYKTEHPHVEIPLSRMAPAVAKEAIDQCKEIDFRAVSKISSDKYICIFCYQEFPNSNSVLETFFWHVVSMHTGEYKHRCSECPKEKHCPYSLDIPPPPKDTKGQLTGYICKKCNFTQLSVENLKTHVIQRHNDEQTFVYNINLSAMSKKELKELSRRSELSKKPAVDTAKISEETKDEDTKHANVSDVSKLKSTIKTSALAPIQSKITFETDDNAGEFSDLDKPVEATIKIEQIETENTDDVARDPPSDNISETERIREEEQAVQSKQQELISSPTSALKDSNRTSNDIVDYPHFKINITESGAKEYNCCINGKDKHFKTTLLISLKKHVQLKHSENWDGYCYVCKVIVTPQGAHTFKDCLQHYLDKHMDNFPLMEKETLPEVTNEPAKPDENPAPQPYINVRPIYELIPTADEAAKEVPSFPIIQSVVSLGAADPPLPSPTYPTMRQEVKSKETFKYEEAQALVMSNKHRVVLETMMARDKLVKVYKCAGRFCSFTSDSLEDALLHASTHQRIGGVDALNCSYCDFNAMGNAIDLVMHVFKEHGHCQYSCGQCFYRAAASQSVGAHATRVHGAAPAATKVLRTTMVTPNAVSEGAMLTREQAVPYYVCANVEANGKACKFRTYTPDKFCEHLQQKHSVATSYPCYICKSDQPSPSELVVHMKSHGLKLYQCTWCVLGANNESELLAHVSMVHPSKQPQAYLRIITNKEGSNELRVLPLAFLNKLKVPTDDVTPSATREIPEREAERSIDLEKLIGLTMLVEPQEPSEPAANTEFTEHSDPDPEPIEPTPPVEPPVEQLSHLKSMLLKPSILSATPGPSQPEEQTPVVPTAPAVDPPASTSPPPRVKTEDVEPPAPLPNDVVVLDSDDDEPRQPVIDLSEEEANTAKIASDRAISTCPKCIQVCKSHSGLKKHLFYCYPNKEEGCRCPHCPYIASNRDNILQHYLDDHGAKDYANSQKRFQCGVCLVQLASVSAVKKHLRTIHKEKDFVVTSTANKAFTNVVVSPAKPERRELPKRKLSGNETTPKRRFGPQDIHSLPINPILEQLVFCAVCEFSTKVRLNMVRHLQLHAEQLPAAHSAPVNPVPHLETNEKHFDKMLNLASSSLGPRPPERREPAERPPPALRMPPELVPRYPRHVPARRRNTCGAQGCAYTSVDEPMLRRHWEALHEGQAALHFRCVHCPTTQITDRSKPITAARVLAHLKMHDENLYACSKCNFYHYKREALERHLTETHPNGQLMIVRESPAAAAAAAAATAAQAAQNVAPTMDLKPWQCGLCEFKSMLRPEVVEHCSKVHQSKMQFRCGYCPYRASALGAVQRHLAHSHAGAAEDVLHYYYRHGQPPDEPDGTPLWLKQRHKIVPTLPEVKTEEDPPEPTPATPEPPPVNLDLVKKEVVEPASVAAESIEVLCMRFGKFCEPNGIKFKCPLCTVIYEDTREAMQSHLFEELQYRKWGCGLCNYKAFHRAGLTDHMTSEHFRQYDHIQLPIDVNKELWVAAQLDHQQAIIDKYKANLSQQKIIVERNKPVLVIQTPPTVEVVEKYSAAQLQEAFGEFGTPMHMMYCCPKCRLTFKEEQVMKDHMEVELNKIRWGCTNCSDKYQTYHEAQFHCKGHDGPSRPKEAIRDPSMRAAWVTNLILAQKRLLQATPSEPATPTSSEPPTPEKTAPEHDNSLLVVRYEERVPTPEVLPPSRKRPAPESDDERLVIDEVGPRKRTDRPCPHCPFYSKYYQTWKEHVLKHFNLKPYTCSYCDFTSTYRQGVATHLARNHPGQPAQIKTTPIPQTPTAAAIQLIQPIPISADEDVPKLICLHCDRSIPENEVDSHLHENIKPDFAKKGDVVVKCCICLVLRLDVASLQEHHNLAHPGVPMNYALFKLHYDTREIHYCAHCDDTAFKFLRDLRTHHNAAHPMLLFKYTTVPYHSDDGKKKESSPPPHKRCARKSTTKLPGGKTVAKKSTTKLPYSVPSTSEDGYSFYNTKPEPLDKYANVTTLMSFCNRMMPFTLKKLSEIINIEPKVIVQDIQADNQ
ncbi:uncharacterized protein LOC124639458 [Helicoverpa zea]|uniref:uncharacterized protein LOC124639458 n=1 Tax=Helicoverpa zea TaxID=7113 RepID=UPI001F56CBE9|nr:uncharacterized protein LOC124639458 [Helicoverpa zea]XP_047032783.1 uncharacterized protein LOC124639458 [Helicoverpa zea]XP_047032784.1 uncharacterized protein LOC124639458 [Helicoverpa zea]XP_047032785.1 uncharacterized protein LOC124639458 [Helicoverpa zea]